MRNKIITLYLGVQLFFIEQKNLACRSPMEYFRENYEKDFDIKKICIFSPNLIPNNIHNHEQLYKKVKKVSR